MNSQIPAYYALTEEQRGIVIPAIYEGLESFANDVTKLRKLKTERNYLSRMRSAYVSTSISDAVDANPHLHLKAEEKCSGFYWYSVIKDLKRNINFLVSNLPTKTNIFNPSGHRSYLSSCNIERMFADGFNSDHIGKDVDVTRSQLSLLMESEFLPFGIVLCYDGQLGKDTIIYEGALHPSQDDWLYKENVAEYKDLYKNVINIKRSSIDELNLSFNKEALSKEEEPILIKLKE